MLAEVEVAEHLKIGRPAAWMRLPTSLISQFNRLHSFLHHR